MTRTKVFAAAGVLALSLALPLGPAAAAEDDATTAVLEATDELYVGGVTETRTVTPAEARGQTISATPPVQAQQQLPVTGGDVLGLVLLGAGAIGAGAVMVRRSRSAA